MPMKTLTRAHLAALQGGCCTNLPNPTSEGSGGTDIPAGGKSETPTPPPPPPPPGS